MKLLSLNEAETLAIGRALGAVLHAGDVVAIDGPLGAGKTRLVRGMAMGMGIDGRVVSSPTFVVVNEYERGEAADGATGAGVGGGGGGGDAGSGGGWGDEGGGGGEAAGLFHVDAYRLSSADDLDSLGWDRVLSRQSDKAVAIEWAERILGKDGTLLGADAWKPDVCRVRMEPVDAPPPGEGPSKRLVVIDPPAAWRSREVWREMARIAEVLADRRPPDHRPGGPLPRGWARCPVTGRAVPPDAASFPFVDERSRMVDLGRWATGAYTVSREITPEDEAEGA